MTYPKQHLAICNRHCLKPCNWVKSNTNPRQGSPRRNNAVNTCRHFICHSNCWQGSSFTQCNRREISFANPFNIRDMFVMNSSRKWFHHCFRVLFTLKQIQPSLLEIFFVIYLKLYKMFTFSSDHTVLQRELLCFRCCVLVNISQIRTPIFRSDQIYI